MSAVAPGAKTCSLIVNQTIGKRSDYRAAWSVVGRPHLHGSESAAARFRLPVGCGGASSIDCAAARVLGGFCSLAGAGRPPSPTPRWRGGIVAEQRPPGTGQIPPLVAGTPSPMRNAPPHRHGLRSMAQRRRFVCSLVSVPGPTVHFLM